MANSAMSWETAARSIRESINNAIRPDWLLREEHKTVTNNVIDVPKSCGLLSSEQLRITELDASILVTDLATGKITSRVVTEAFCARAAIAHQLVSKVPNTQT